MKIQHNEFKDKKMNIHFYIRNILLRLCMLVTRYSIGMPRVCNRKKRVYFFLSFGVGDMIYFRAYVQRWREVLSADEYEIYIFGSSQIFPLHTFSEDHRDRIATRLDFLKVILKNCFDPDIFICVCNAPGDVWNCKVYHPKMMIMLTTSMITQKHDYFGISERDFYHVNTKTIEERLAILLSLYTGRTEQVCFPDWSDFPIPERQYKEKYVLICPGAADPGRRWPPEHFSVIADYVIEKYHYPILITGREKEKYLGDVIMEKCVHRDKIKNLCGNTSIQELFSLVKNSELLITNETGTSHIAAVMKTKEVVIFGYGDYGSFFPCHPDFYAKDYVHIAAQQPQPKCMCCHWINADCRQNKNEPYRCISAITCHDVIAKIDSVFVQPEDIQ